MNFFSLSGSLTFLLLISCSVQNPVSNLLTGVKGDTGSKFLEKDFAWFTTPSRPICFDIKRQPCFPLTEDQVKEGRNPLTEDELETAVRKSFEVWLRYVTKLNLASFNSDKKEYISPYYSTRLLRKGHKDCSEIDLTFYFGDIDSEYFGEKAEEILQDFAKDPSQEAMYSRDGYDSENMWPVDAYVWVRGNHLRSRLSQTNANPKNRWRYDPGSGSLPQFDRDIPITYDTDIAGQGTLNAKGLEIVFIHEWGHIFGNGHIEDTVMDSDYFDNYVRFYYAFLTAKSFNVYNQAIYYRSAHEVDKIARRIDGKVELASIPLLKDHNGHNLSEFKNCASKFNLSGNDLQSRFSCQQISNQILFDVMAPQAAELMFERMTGKSLRDQRFSMIELVRPSFHFYSLYNVLTHELLWKGELEFVLDENMGAKNKWRFPVALEPIGRPVAIHESMGYVNQRTNRIASQRALTREFHGTLSYPADHSRAPRKKLDLVIIQNNQGFYEDQVYTQLNPSVLTIAIACGNENIYQPLFRVSNAGNPFYPLTANADDYATWEKQYQLSLSCL